MTHQYPTDVSNQINAIIVGHPTKKNKFCKHIQKVIREAEKYWQYLQDERQKSKGTEHKKKDKWFLYDAFLMDWEMGECVYFAGEESFVQFYMEEKPKPDPLSYLHSMIWSAVGQEYEGLELLDYQFILLAIIHDAQNLTAGRECIYFNPLKGDGLSDRLCRAVWHSLEKNQASKDIQGTINTAIRAVIAVLDGENTLSVNKPQGKDRQGEIETKSDKRQTITLQQFFNDYCDLSKRPDITSKREMLLREDREGRIKLPLVGKKKNYRKGQTYLFCLDSLLENWTTYRKKLTTLPPLKETGNK